MHSVRCIATHPFHSDYAIFSNFTLAFFEDSGWYQVNYTYINNFKQFDLQWGKGSLILAWNSCHSACMEDHVTLTNMQVLVVSLSWSLVITQRRTLMFVMSGWNNSALLIELQWLVYSEELIHMSHIKSGRYL